MNGNMHPNRVQPLTIVRAPPQALDESPLLRLAMHGTAGVDVFLVCCGMWAALSLVPAMERAAADPKDAPGAGVWPAVKAYYRKRVLRVLPPYATALLLVAFAIDHSKVSWQEGAAMERTGYPQ